MILDHFRAGGAEVDRLGEAAFEPVAANDESRRPERENRLPACIHGRIMPRLEHEPLDHQPVAGGTSRVAIHDDDRQRETIHKRQRLNRSQHRLRSASALACRPAVAVERHGQRTVKGDVGHVHHQRELLLVGGRVFLDSLVSARRNHDGDSAGARRELTSGGPARSRRSERSGDGAEVCAIGRLDRVGAYQQGGDVVTVADVVSDATAADLHDATLCGRLMAHQDFPRGGQEQLRCRPGGRRYRRVRSAGHQQPGCQQQSAQREGRGEGTLVHCQGPPEG